MIVYPNPMQDEVNVIIENLIDEQLTIEIFDETGRIVYRQNFMNKNAVFYTIIDLKQLNPAVYFIKCKSEKLLLNEKLIKQ